MVRTVVIAILVVICSFGVNGMPGKSVGRGSNTSGERRGGGGGGYYHRGSDKRDASVSSESGCSGEIYESRESTYGRDDSIQMKDFVAARAEPLDHRYLL